MINNYKIYPASNKDIIEVKNIVFSVLEEYGLKPNQEGIDDDLDDIETNYLNNNGFFGIIKNNNNNKILGTFALYKVDNDVCEIRKMYFLPSLRGKGWGKKVIKFLVTKAIENGYKKIVLETNQVLKEAISLYEKCGFKKLENYNLHSRCDQAYVLELIAII
ncbi:MAG: GNAT family N-acetyltransferase [Candidatus Sericytochromatia bacterium]